jgi:hypothetical protein
MDEELFTLCKSVYEKTGWDESTEIIRKYSLNKEPSVFMRPPKGMELGVLSGTIEWQSPLYTSDYLLEKLPPVIFVRTSDGNNNTAILTVWINGDKTAHAAYMIPFDEQNRGDYAQTSDTPLKALLKLTLALHEAGELNTEPNTNNSNIEVQEEK